MAFGGTKNKSGGMPSSKKANSTSSLGGAKKSGLPGKKLSANKQKKEHEFYTVGTIWEGPHGVYASTDDYFCDFLVRHDDTGRFFKASSIRVTESEQKGVEYELSVNLKNDKQVTLLDDDGQPVPGGVVSKGKDDHEIISIGVVKAGKYGEYISAGDKFEGTITILHRETGRFFEALMFKIGNPFNKSIKNFLAEISLNLKNEKHARFLGSDDD